MGVDCNAKGVGSNSDGFYGNAEGFNINANSQPLLALPPFDYYVEPCDMSQFLCNTASADDRLSWEK